MPSAVPVALDRLLLVLRDALDCAVHDGPPVTASTPDYVCVGYDPATPEAVTFEREWRSLGARTREETFDIACVAVTSKGDLDMLSRRARLFELLDAVEAAISADLTLGGAVRVAQVLGRGALLQEQDKQGATAAAQFSVRCTARIT